jgi:hypothetical protein
MEMTHARLAFRFSLLLAGILSFQLTACFQPTFDPAVSAGALLAEKLGEPAKRIGPVQSMYWSAGTISFIPERLPDTDRGVVTWSEAEWTRWTWLSYDSKGGAYMAPISGEARFPAGAAKPFLATTVPEGPQPELLVVEGNSLAAFTDDGSPTTGLHTTLTNWNLPWNLVGIGATALPGGTDTLLAFLFHDGGNLGAVVVPRGLFAPPPKPLPLPTTVAGADLLPGGTFFAASVDGPFVYGEPGTARVAIWETPASTPLVTSLDEPLAGLLMDGTLVAQGPLMLSTWDIHGTLLTTMPAGDIRFVHEIATAAGARCVLTQTRQGSGMSENGKITIAIWEIPEAAFLALGK